MWNTLAICSYTIHFELFMHLTKVSRVEGSFLLKEMKLVLENMRGWRYFAVENDLVACKVGNCTHKYKKTSAVSNNLTNHIKSNQIMKKSGKNI